MFSLAAWTLAGCVLSGCEGRLGWVQGRLCPCFRESGIPSADRFRCWLSELSYNLVMDLNERRFEAFPRELRRIGKRRNHSQHDILDLEMALDSDWTSMDRTVFWLHDAGGMTYSEIAT